MSAPNVPVTESNKETVDNDDGEELVEVGSIKNETKGSPLGTTLDPSGNDYKFPH